MFLVSTSTLVCLSPREESDFQAVEPKRRSDPHVPRLSSEFAPASELKAES